MEKNSFYIEIVPVDCWTHLLVSVWHNRKMVLVTTYPANKNNQCLITSGQTTVMEPMPRLNRKRLESLVDVAKQQILAKDGPAWHVVQKQLPLYQVK